MEIDRGKVDDAVLALLFLTLHEGNRAWKSFDWDAMNRLYEKGWIEDPVNKAKSVELTNSGKAEAQRLFERMFCRPK